MIFEPLLEAVARSNRGRRSDAYGLTPTNASIDQTLKDAPADPVSPGRVYLKGVSSENSPNLGGDGVYYCWFLNRDPRSWRGRQGNRPRSGRTSRNGRPGGAYTSGGIAGRLLRDVIPSKLANHGRELQFRLLQGDPPAVDGRACDSRPKNMGVRAAWWRRGWNVRSVSGCGRTAGFHPWIPKPNIPWLTGWGIRPRTPKNIAPPFGRLFGDPGALLDQGIGELILASARIGA